MNEQPHMRTVADVDVIIPLYNAAPFIQEAVTSVLEQSVLPKRVIVVDDGSTDDGAARVEAMIAGGTPTTVQLFRQSNKGPNAARDLGLRHASATYVAFLDADDRWLPRKLELQLGRFANPREEGLLLVYCGARTFGAENAPSHLAPKVVETPLRGRVFERLLAKNRITGGASAVLIKRSCFDQLGSFDVSLRTSEDFDMWLRISQSGSIDLVEEVLVELRDHPANHTKKALHMLEGILLFNAKWFGHAQGDPDVLKEWAHLIALFALRAGDTAAAKKLVDRILSRDQQRTIFHRTFGSFHLHMWLKRLRSILDPRSA